MSLLAPEAADATAPAAILDRQALRESSARTYARWLPIVRVRASGMVIEGADGCSYLDCLSGAGTLALGHNHPVVVAALRAILERGVPLHALDMTLEALAAAGAIRPKERVAEIAADVARLPFPYTYRCPVGIGGGASSRLGAIYVERMLAGAATLRYVISEELPARAAKLGERIKASLRQLACATDCIGDVRGRGLMIGIELVAPDGEPDVTGARSAAPALAQRVRAEALGRGLIIELGGRHDAVVRLLPPLTISDEQADAVIERLARAIVAASRG